MTDTPTILVNKWNNENRQERSEVEIEEISGSSQDLNPGPSEFLSQTLLPTELLGPDGSGASVGYGYL